MHHPILGVNVKVDEIGKLKNRSEVVALLIEKTNKVTIYCGHYHMESTLVYKNITQYITPAVSFQVEKNPNEVDINTTFFGYRIIEIDSGTKSSKIQLFRHAD